MLSLILPAITTFSILQQRKHLLKKEVKSKLASINADKLEKFSFTYKQSNEDLDWKHSKEFEYKGKMYDVVSIQKGRDSIRYTCWLDKEETELNIKLKTILFNECLHDKPIKQCEVTFYSYYKSLFFVQYNPQSFHFIEQTLFLKKEHKKSSYHFLIIQSNLRPPNFLSC